MANFNSYLYNEYRIYNRRGSFTWTKPSDIDISKPILVHVWGAGGMGDDYYHFTPITATGGGGGGLAVKLVAVSALGSTETVTIGTGRNNANAVAGSSSFGSHCSATGGNGGAFNTANEGSSADYGVGGMGVGGDVNKRGGTGGVGYHASTTNAGGGGGGSAPAPYGVSNGFNGGNGYTYAGGGGGGIGAVGTRGNYIGGSGGGSMSSSPNSLSPSSYYSIQPAGCGLFGAGGTGGALSITYTTNGDGPQTQGEEGKGSSIIDANTIALGGGGGSAGMFTVRSSYQQRVNATGGGPGAGGGGVGKFNTVNYATNSGSGGMLGGGGGSPGYAHPGQGGNAGGGGGSGYYNGGGVINRGNGGDGIVIIQYARLFT